jgi:hypothetical protein
MYIKKQLDFKTAYIFHTLYCLVRERALATVYLSLSNDSRSRSRLRSTNSVG